MNTNLPDLDHDLRAAVEYSNRMDEIVRQIFALPECIKCGRTLVKRGLCDDCRTAQEEADIEVARSEGGY